MRLQQTIAKLRAGKNPRLSAALDALDGQPAGQFGFEDQTLVAIRAELPLTRSYLLINLIDRVFIVDDSGHYRRVLYPAA